MQSIEDKVLSRIYGMGRGSVVTPARFSDLGTPAAIRIALLRLKRADIIHQLARGLYAYPQMHDKMGMLTPSADAIAKAVACRDATRLQPSGAYAANLLGLSEQVPMKIIFLTDGPNRRVIVRKMQIVLKRTTPRNMATAGTVSGLVIQALRYLGRNHVDQRIINVLRNRLTHADKERILKDVRYAPAWIAQIMRQLGQPKD